MMNLIMKSVFYCMMILTITSSLILSSEKLNDQSYYPLQMNNNWFYDNENFPHNEKIVDTMRVGDKVYFGLAVWLEDEAEHWLREEMNKIYLYHIPDSTEFVLFNFNADTGESWKLPSYYNCDFGSEITLISREDTVITPAGIFYNCFHFKHNPKCMDAGIYETWFAKGVGKIKYMEDNFIGMMQYELSDYYNGPTSIDLDGQLSQIKYYQLYQNYPNPFNNITIIRYNLLNTGYVELKIYNLLGQEIITLVSGEQVAGTHRVMWNASNFAGGIYFYKLVVDKNIFEKRKMLFLK